MSCMSFLCLTLLAHGAVYLKLEFHALYIMCVLLMWLRAVTQAEAVTQEEEPCPLESLTQKDEGKQ